MTRPRLVIADDHPLFRLGLAYALRGKGFEVVAEAADGTGAVEACRRLTPDGALFDCKMPRLDGIEACREAVARRPALRVILLTTFGEPALIAAAREAGAAAFLSKDTEVERLASLLLRIIGEPGYTVFPEAELPRLTPRELEVLRWLSEGLTNKEIARRVSLSPETVKEHVMNVYRKLDVEDRVGAARRARTLGLA